MIYFYWIIYLFAFLFRASWGILFCLQRNAKVVYKHGKAKTRFRGNGHIKQSDCGVPIIASTNHNINKTLSHTHIRVLLGGNCFALRTKNNQKSFPGTMRCFRMRTFTQPSTNARKRKGNEEGRINNWTKCVHAPGRQRATIFNAFFVFDFSLPVLCLLV